MASERQYQSGDIVRRRKPTMLPEFDGITMYEADTEFLHEGAWGEVKTVNAKGEILVHWQDIGASWWLPEQIDFVMDAKEPATLQSQASRLRGEV